MAFFLFLTALVQGAEKDAVLAIRVEGCGGRGLYELKPEILSILQDVSGETNLTWEHGICKEAGAMSGHGKAHHFVPREEIRAFCTNATNATNATPQADDKQGPPRCERCGAHCLKDCHEVEAAECLATAAFESCHEECLAKNTSGKPMGEGNFGKKRGEKREGGKSMGEGNFGDKREGGKPMGNFGDKREGGKPMGNFGDKREGGKPMGDFGKKPAMLVFAAPSAAAARLGKPESRDQLQARVCELLSAASKTKNATEPCVVALERPQCDAEGFPMIAVSGIAGAAVILVAFVAGCRSIRRRRSTRVVKNGVLTTANDLETGAAQPDLPSKTRDSDLVSEASTAFTARPTTVTTVAGGVGAPTVARSELQMS